jgi:hypothetical protein
VKAVATSHYAPEVWRRSAIHPERTPNTGTKRKIFTLEAAVRALGEQLEIANRTAILLPSANAPRGASAGRTSCRPC